MRRDVAMRYLNVFQKREKAKKASLNLIRSFLVVGLELLQPSHLLTIREISWIDVFSRSRVVTLTAAASLW